jgi:WD40 repeat protein
MIGRLPSLGRPRVVSARLDQLMALEASDERRPLSLDDYCRQLIDEGLWWDCCREAARCRSDLLEVWTTAPVLENCWALSIADAASDPDGGGRGQLGVQARRLLRIAQLARLVGPASNEVEDEEASELLSKIVDDWRTSNLLPTRRMGEGVPSSPTLPATERVADLLDPLPGGAARTFVAWQAMLLASPLREDRRIRSRQSTSAKVLFDPMSQDAGLSGTLHLEVEPDGPSGLFPDPRTMGTLLVDQEFEHSITAAWQHQSRNRRTLPSVRWRLELDGRRVRSVGGQSLGAAFAVLLAELLGPPGRSPWLAAPQTRAVMRAGLRWFRVSRGNQAITGAVSRDGDLKQVEGMAAKLSRAKTLGLQVVAPEENKKSSAPLAAGVDIVWVPNVGAARRALYRTSRTRVVAVGAVVALVLSGTVGGVAYGQYQKAQEESRIALSRELVAKALDAQNEEPALARQLIAAAYRVSPTAQARGALLNALKIPGSIRVPRSGVAPFSAALAYSPDSRYLAVGIHGTIYIYEPTAGKKIAELSSYAGEIGDVSFSPDGRLLATGDGFGDEGASRPGALRIWDVSAADHPVLRATVKYPDAVGSIFFSADGKKLSTASGLEKPPRVWNITDPDHPTEYRNMAPPGKSSGSLVFAPGGRRALTGGTKGITLWDLSAFDHLTHPVVLPGTFLEYPASFSHDGAMLAALKTDNKIELWKISDNRPPVSVGPFQPHLDNVSATKFLGSKARTLLVMNDQEAEIWDLSNPKYPTLVTTITPPGERPMGGTLTVSPNGRFLATATQEGLIRLWNIGNPISPGALAVGEVVPPVPDLGDPSATASRGWTIMTTSRDGGWSYLNLWDLSTPESPRLIARHNLGLSSEAYLSPDGKVLALANSSSRVAASLELWDVSRPAKLALLSRTQGPGGGPSGLTFSPDGRTLALGYTDLDAPNLPHVNQLWDITDPKNPRARNTLQEPTADSSASFTFSPDQNMVATTIKDGVRIWNISDPNKPRSLGAVTNKDDPLHYPAFTQDNKHVIVSGSQGVWKIWDIDERQGLSNGATMFKSPTGSSNGTVVSPTGWLAALTDSGSTHLFDITDPRHPLALTETAGDSFSPAGNFMVAGRGDGGIEIWDTNYDSLIRRLCESIGTKMTRQVWNEYLPHEDYAPPCS